MIMMREGPRGLLAVSRVVVVFATVWATACVCVGRVCVCVWRGRARVCACVRVYDIMYNRTLGRAEAAHVCVCACSAADDQMGSGAPVAHAAWPLDMLKSKGGVTVTWWHILCLVNNPRRDVASCQRPRSWFGGA